MNTYLNYVFPMYECTENGVRSFVLLMRYIYLRIFDFPF